MPLHIEVYNRHLNRWVEVAASPVQPGAVGGSMSNLRPDGVREVLHFRCLADDSHSTLSRAAETLEINRHHRAVNLDPDQLQRVAEITPTAPYELDVRTDREHEPRRIRFRHRRRSS